MRGAWGAISFSSSTCHHGLKTAPEGDFFKSLMNVSTDLVDTMLNSKSQAPTSKEISNPNLRIIRAASWNLVIGVCLELVRRSEFVLWRRCWNLGFGILC